MSEVELQRRAQALFVRLLDLDDREREAALARAEAEDPAAAARARRMLELDSETEVPDPEADPAGLLGHALGPYEVVELIGTGGMGAVYRGRRRDPEETVAIKFLPAIGAWAEAVARFKYETELLASFRHPGIVGFRHSGKARDGSRYLVMEYVPGEPLSPALPAVRESVEKTVDFVIGAAAAVQYMHGRAALHRDLKPGNILVRADGDRPRPVLIDMGIARQLQARDGDAMRRTMGPVGTPAYMSPEQVRASPDVDVTTDVFGLGAVLFELLAGRPARGLGELREWDCEVVERRLAEPARPPSGVVDAEVFGADRASKRARRIRGDLDAIVVKSLEPDPADRYPSVEAFSADLYRWLDHRPVVARPIHAWGRTWRLMRRKPGATVAVIAIALVLIGTSIVTSLSLRRERRAQAALAEQLETTTLITRFVEEDVFDRASPEFGGPDQSVVQLVRDVATDLDDRLDERPAVALGMRSVLVAVLSSMGDLEGASEQADAGWPLARSLPSDHPQRMKFELAAADLWIHRQENEAAERAVRAVLPRLEAAGSSALDLRVSALTILGVALLEQNRLGEAGAALGQALELSPPTDRRHFVVLATDALLQAELHGPERGISALEAALAEAERRVGPNHVWVIALAANLARAHMDLGRYEAALPYNERALEIADRRLAPDHPTRLSVLNNLCGCLTRLGKFDEAIAIRRDVLESRTAQFGESNPAVGLAASNLASTLILAGQPEQSLEPAELATRITMNTLGPDHPDTGRAHHTLAAALHAVGEVDLSLEVLDRAIEIFSRAEGNHETRLEQLQVDRAAWGGSR